MPTPAATPSTAEMRSRLDDLMLRDRHRLRRRLDGTRKIRDAATRHAVLGEIETHIAAAEARVTRRRAAITTVDYPAELPVAARKDDLAAAIRDHQVVIVAGETGSGKTTQLPKICLELGRGIHGAIGHTQPRRLAARTVAERIAAELGTEPGTTVGYKVRFTDHASDDTLVKLMTDGILLAEVAGDPHLRGYDTLIIDEAHERSLNIDFLLGYLKQLLPRRPDLKVIITSATIDPERFSRHFDDAPVLEVSGRTYPVEIRYRPIVDPDDDTKAGQSRTTRTSTGKTTRRDNDRDQTQAICDAVDELRAEGSGDILVFLSGEREIRDTADALTQHTRHHPNTEILPLYARLSAAEQHRVFQPHTGRRIVLTTNVAETSLTVPGIRYVIDPGTARISRYSNRTKVQRLPIEAVSQASARQRAGRCGRTSEGICIRLYTEDDFQSRPAFTDPEILRTNLASVILQMAHLGLGDITAFPFVDPPDNRAITDGIHLLHELGALRPGDTHHHPHLTDLGRRLAHLPLDPRLGRMILEAAHNGCVAEVLVITAALSIQDPRERPADATQAADTHHARFADDTSDFLTYLNLWNYLRDTQRATSGNQFRKLCRNEFLNYLRIREWQDIHSQLRQITRNTLGIHTGDQPASAANIHRSLLAGLLSHIGVKNTDTPKPGDKPKPADKNNDYLGARGARFAIFPGSTLAKKPPRWVMAAELVETSRLFARTTARIDPQWIEPLADHVVTRTYSEPRWDRRRGAVMATERVTLYGVPIVVGRSTNYGRIDPTTARELFIRHALVEGQWDTDHAFFHHNQQLLDAVDDLEHRARRRDLRVDDDVLFDFYDQRLGADVVSARHFDTWWKKTRREQPDLLTLDPDTLTTADTSRISHDYPDQLHHGPLTVPLSYHFDPGTDHDGVTAEIPVATLNQLHRDHFDWHVPGLRDELVTALIKTLPKNLRRNFVPAPDYARAVLARLTPGEKPLLDALSDELAALTGVRVHRDDWRPDQLPTHLTITYRVVDDHGHTLDEGKDLDTLKARLRPDIHTALSSVAGDLEQHGLRDWTFDTLPHVVEHHRDGQPVKAHPALVDDGDSVAIRLFDTDTAAATAMWHGTRRLLLLTSPSPAKHLHKRLTNTGKLALARAPHTDTAAVLDDCITAAADTLLARHGGVVWTPADFAALRDAVRADLHDTAADALAHVEAILAATQTVEARLADATSPALAEATADIRAQLDTLIHPGFVTTTGCHRLPHLRRYLHAIDHRLDKLPHHPQRDRERMHAVHALQHDLAAARDQGHDTSHLRWMIEELRVSYFAQPLGTAGPISEKRIRRALDELTGSPRS